MLSHKNVDSSSIVFSHLICLLRFFDDNTTAVRFIFLQDSNSSSQSLKSETIGTIRTIISQHSGDSCTTQLNDMPTEALAKQNILIKLFVLSVPIIDIPIAAEKR